MSELSYYPITFGCDPEFFFRKDGEVIGAEQILPRTGLEITGCASKIIIDGVQAELNPHPSACREVMGKFIGESFRVLREHMKTYARVGIDFTQTIKLSDGDFNRLSDDSKKFGCMPSKNAADGGKVGKINVNPETYRFRSAGGHLHIGDGGSHVVQAVLQDPVRLVRMMDILVGNTCVLIDRDPGNVERRKVYGRAGEFRTPPHGVEYRTLSNFWLRSYQLMSLVMGLARHAVIIVANNRDAEFVERVNMDEIYRAINTNNFSLALRNFKKIERLLLEITPETDEYPIHKEVIKDFRHFVKKGVGHWFKEDPCDHWADLDPGREPGFRDFLAETVRSQRTSDH